MMVNNPVVCCIDVKWSEGFKVESVDKAQQIKQSHTNDETSRLRNFRVKTSKRSLIRNQF